MSITNTEQLLEKVELAYSALYGLHVRAGQEALAPEDVAPVLQLMADIRSEAQALDDALAAQIMPSGQETLSWTRRA